MHHNVASVIYQDFDIKMELYIVVRSVVLLGDKILPKTTIRCKSITLQISQNQNRFHWLAINRYLCFVYIIKLRDWSTGPTAIFVISSRI